MAVSMPCSSSRAATTREARVSRSRTFQPAGNPLTGQGGNRNIVFRIPTPLFGAGSDRSDSGLRHPRQSERQHTGRSARPGSSVTPTRILGGNTNRSVANDGTITRFGWKRAGTSRCSCVCRRSLQRGDGHLEPALPQGARYETPNCQGGYPTPNDTDNFPHTAAPPAAPPVLSSTSEAFANFMRMLALPAAAPATASTQRGSAAVFASIGCALQPCHRCCIRARQHCQRFLHPAQRPALSHQQVRLFFGPVGAPDGHAPGGWHHAGRSRAGTNFGTAPLWGVGQRQFFPA